MKALTWLLNIALVAVFIMGATVVGPAIETRFFPVYSKFRILKVEPAADGRSSIFTIELRKMRECIPQGYAWYVTDLGNFIQQINVVANSRNPAPSLPVGKFVTSFTADGVTAEDIPKLYAETFSRCHPFWITRTVVFP